MNHQIATRIRLAREMSGLSIRQAAQILGIHHAAIALAEAGANPTDYGLIAKLAGLYRVTPAYLRGEGLDKICPEDSGFSPEDLAKLSPKDLDTVMTIIADIAEQGAS